MERGLSLVVTGGLTFQKTSSPHTKKSHQPCVQGLTAPFARGFLELVLGPTGRSSLSVKLSPEVRGPSAMMAAALYLQQSLLCSCF